MKKILSTLFIVASFVLSCTKVDNVRPDTSQIPMTPEEARMEFARVLSKAVAESAELRNFIKVEAMQQFDRDYDVFYPFVKDKLVSEGMTFKELLLQYSDADLLNQIEFVEPKLNILVPDWKWLGAFSIHDWNPTQSDIAVGFQSNLEKRPIFAEGNMIGELELNQFPDFPLLIVKSNERMVQKTPRTKSSPAQYDFADSAFDRSLSPDTKVEHQYYEVEIDGTPYTGNFMSPSNLNPYVIGAYNEFNDNVYAAHRDYVYYGMTNSIQEGRLNTRINECIHKIKLRGEYLSHDCIRESGDFVDKGQLLEYKENNLWQTAQGLRDTFYSEGNIELKFHIIIGNKSEVASLLDGGVVHATFSNLYSIVNADLDYRHRTWFNRDWFVYTVDYADFLPKWFEVNLRLPNWDISSQSAVVVIQVEECDDGATYTYERNVQSTYMQNFSLDASLNGVVDSVNFKVGLGYGYSSTDIRSEKVTIQRTDTSDDLGSAYLNYMDPVIISEATKDGVSGYNVKTFSTGVVDMMILPIFE